LALTPFRWERYTTDPLFGEAFMGIEGTYLLTHEDTTNIHESKLSRDYLEDIFKGHFEYKYSAIDACELEAPKIARQKT
jgi:hypothetical protein